MNPTNEAQKNLVVGIVGRIGSGKTTVSRILAEKYHFIPIEVDIYGHKALEIEKERLIEEFGTGILGETGLINRKILGQLVFSNANKLTKLNSIVHPRMKEEIRREIAEAQGKRFVVDAALLFEMGLDELCDYIISVDAPDEEIVRRVKTYRGMEEKQVRNILNIQQYLEFLKDKTNFIIFNNKDEQKLHKQIEFFILEIL